MLFVPGLGNQNETDGVKIVKQNPAGWVQEAQKKRERRRKDVWWMGRADS